MSIRFSGQEPRWEISNLRDRITRAVRTCVLRISTAARRNAGIKEYLQCTDAASNQPTIGAPMEDMNPCYMCAVEDMDLGYMCDTTNQQAQEDDFYPEARALSPEEECLDSLGGFEEYMDGEGGDAEGYFSMSDGEFALEFFRDEGFPFLDIPMEDGEYGNGGSGGTPSFTFGAGDEMVWVGDGVSPFIE